MKRWLGRTIGVSVVAIAVAAVFVQVASANYAGSNSITCNSATYSFSTFPTGTQDVLETIFVDGSVDLQTTYTFTGPTGSNTVQFTLPNDGLPHTIEADAYSITNGTPVFGLSGGAVTLTCGTTPPPPAVCTYTKGYYRNHADVTATVIAGMGGTIQLGSAALNAAQAQTILNATPGKGSVSSTSNLLLNLAQQILSAELNGARGSSESSDVQNALASANGGIAVGLAGGQISLSSSLPTMSSLEATIESFNSTNDCTS